MWKSTSLDIKARGYQSIERAKAAKDARWASCQADHAPDQKIEIILGYICVFHLPQQFVWWLFLLCDGSMATNSSYSQDSLDGMLIYHADWYFAYFLHGFWKGNKNRNRWRRAWWEKEQVNSHLAINKQNIWLIHRGTKRDKYIKKKEQEAVPWWWSIWKEVHKNCRKIPHIIFCSRFYGLRPSSCLRGQLWLHD